jgi:hypothetical protein
MGIGAIRWIYGFTTLLVIAFLSFIGWKLLPAPVALVLSFFWLIWLPFFSSARDALLIRHEAWEIHQRSTEHVLRLIDEVKRLRIQIAELEIFKASAASALGTALPHFVDRYEDALQVEKCRHEPDLSVLEDIEAIMNDRNADAAALIEEERVRYLGRARTTLATPTPYAGGQQLTPDHPLRQRLRAGMEAYLNGPQRTRHQAAAQAMASPAAPKQKR